MGMILFVITTSFLFFGFRNLLHEESDLCQPLQNHLRLFGGDGRAGLFFEDPLGASDELGGEGGHGGDIYVCAVFIIKNPLVNNDREGQRVTFFCRSFFSSFSAGFISEITLNSKSEC